MRKPNKPTPRRARGPTKTKTTEITRISRGMHAAGLTVRGVEVDPATGKYRVLIGDPASETKRADANPWDENNAEDEKRTA